VLANREQIHQEAHLRAERVDDPCTPLQVTEGLAQLAVDAELPEVGAESHEPGHTGQSLIDVPAPDPSRVRSAHRSSSLVTVSALAARNVPTHLPGASRVLPRLHRHQIGCAREALLSSRETILLNHQPGFRGAKRREIQAQGVSYASVRRIWNAHGLKPHLVETFKLSTDPEFVEKVHDVVGLYMNPPTNALVLSVDEKSQIQALDRTQPGLPLKRGRCSTMTHDYKRNGTTTLFAALDVLTGKVLGRCMPRHRHQEFLRFLRTIERETDPGLDVHIILDNYGTHKHPDVLRWLAKNPRFHFHFTPTSASWLNLVERWFRELTDKAIRRGVFHSVGALETAIDVFIGSSNAAPKPFVWTARADAIIEKVTRGKAKLDSLHEARLGPT
jgi:transposase